MKLLLLLPLLPFTLAAREVFAHYILGNAAALTQPDWESDIALAAASSIDGFALNVAHGDPHNAASLANAFAAASAVAPTTFRLYFSFDYEALGPWPPSAVIDLLRTYSSHPSYFKANGTRPLVSTFEGPAHASDWPAIKAATNCFFIPDWTSLGPQAALSAAGGPGVVDGLASWDAWPRADAPPGNGSGIVADAGFTAALAGTGGAYMMPVSPWFYTNLPGYRKNWLWRSDGLWEARWAEVVRMQPDFVQILTWNDYGESHYIGPVREKALGLFDAAGAAVNYVKGVDHEGWRAMLGFWIARYKGAAAAAAVGEERLVVSYRRYPCSACADGQTTGGNRNFGETVVPPQQLMKDAVFYSVSLNGVEDVTTTIVIGSSPQAGTLTLVEGSGGGGAGLYTGSVPFGGKTGPVSVTVSRGGKVVAVVQGGPAITTDCENGLQNWNPVSLSSVAMGKGAVDEPAVNTTPPVDEPVLPAGPVLPVNSTLPGGEGNVTLAAATTKAESSTTVALPAASSCD
ncbi:alpha-1,3-glucanase [Podospora conica]|nr:alpha-1,3-glucanase [Schizothecium conicum]